MKPNKQQLLTGALVLALGANVSWSHLANVFNHSPSSLWLSSNGFDIKVQSEKTTQLQVDGKSFNVKWTEAEKAKGAKSSDPQEFKFKVEAQDNSLCSATCGDYSEQGKTPEDALRLLQAELKGRISLASTVAAKPTTSADTAKKDIKEKKSVQDFEQDFACDNQSDVVQCRIDELVTVSSQLTSSDANKKLVNQLFDKYLKKDLSEVIASLPEAPEGFTCGGSAYQTFSDNVKECRDAYNDSREEQRNYRQSINEYKEKMKTIAQFMKDIDRNNGKDVRSRLSEMMRDASADHLDQVRDSAKTYLTNFKVNPNSQATLQALMAYNQEQTNSNALFSGTLSSLRSILRATDDNFTSSDYRRYVSNQYVAPLENYSLSLQDLINNAFIKNDPNLLNQFNAMDLNKLPADVRALVLDQQQQAAAIATGAQLLRGVAPAPNQGLPSTMPAATRW